MNLLPDELLIHIISFLSLQNLPTFFSVNKKYSSLSYNNMIWKDRLRKEFPNSSKQSYI